MKDKIVRDYSLLPFAKELRHDMTQQERKLWYMFLRKYPVRIYKQRIIGHYIADFYCSTAKLVIELDGSQHYSDEGLLSDQKRTEYLKSIGLEVIPFTNEQIDHQFDDVCYAIDRMIKERSQ